ncbi:MAG: hypothetical protein C4526_01930 [Nitrospiraceae bacterium]|nr:MAG: hypothetical protein C4526_01930 [Nitrospiraceae bacterium]
MGEKRFSMQEAIKFGWDAMKNNLGFLIVLLIIAFLIENLPGFIAGYARSDFPPVSYALYVTGWLLGFVVQMGLIKISLKFCDGIKGQLDDLLSSFDILVTFVTGSVLYFLIILGGILLLIIPGVVWGVKFSLFPYFIVDKGLGPVQALKASAEATTGAKWDLFLFGLLLGLINVAGALCFLVGLFATVPTSMIAYAYVYRKLTGEGRTKAMHIDWGI